MTETATTATSLPTVQSPRQPSIRVLLAGGGTGGHLVPAIALAQALRERDANTPILFVGAADRMEALAVPAAGFDFAPISVHGLMGRWSLSGLMRRLRGALEVLSGLPLWQSIAILRRFRPDVVVGTGGYVCGPVLLAAWLRRIPTLLLEQNEDPGATSRLVMPIVSAAAVVSEGAARPFRKRGVRVETVGTPVRPLVMATTREEGVRALGLSPSRKTLAILGGSLGSRAVNSAAAGALKALAEQEWFRSGWQTVHITGRGRDGAPMVAEMKGLGVRYTAYDFRDDVHHVLAAADAVVTRAGGTFLAEISARGIPMVVVPWSGAAQDHQTHNALPFAEAGAAIIISDSELTATRLAATLESLLPDEGRLRAMAEACRSLGHPEATDRILTTIRELCAARQEKRPGRGGGRK